MPRSAVTTRCLPTASQSDPIGSCQIVLSSQLERRARRRLADERVQIRPWSRSTRFVGHDCGIAHVERKRSRESPEQRDKNLEHATALANETSLKQTHAEAHSRRRKKEEGIGVKELDVRSLPFGVRPRGSRLDSTGAATLPRYGQTLAERAHRTQVHRSKRLPMQRNSARPLQTCHQGDELGNARRMVSLISNLPTPPRFVGQHLP